jgi:hypothetical protein
LGRRSDCHVEIGVTEWHLLAAHNSSTEASKPGFPILFSGRSSELNPVEWVAVFPFLSLPPQFVEPLSIKPLTGQFRIYSDK